MNKTFDERIANEKEELSKVKSQMEVVKQKFITEAAEFTKKWYSKEAREIITNNPDKSAKLSDDELKDLKNEVLALIEQTDELVREKFDRDEFWWHIKENPHTYPTYQSRIPDFLQDVLKTLLGKIATIFAKKELIKIDTEYSGERYDANASNFVFKGKDVRYRYGLSNIGNLEGIMQEYGKLHEKAKAHLNQIEKLKLDQKRENIGDIWDTI